MFNPIRTVALIYFKLKNTDPIPVKCGKNIVSGLYDSIHKAGYRSVFISCGGTIRRKGMLDELIEKLGKNGIKTTVYSEIKSDPTVSQVENGLKLLKENNCDCVIAAGGGSVLDCTKVIALRASNPLIPVSLMSFYIRPLRRSLPLYMIPTTSGTGSEITYFSVITDENKKMKRAVITDKYMPEEIIFDTELLRHVPHDPTVYAGLDALTHTVESYISSYKSSFPEDAESAPKVVHDIFTYLPSAASDPDNEEAREKMAMAAYNAGINFRRISVGYVHAIAHRLGETYHIPHGMACAAVMPHVLRHSMPQAKKDLDELAVKSGIAANAEDLIEKIEKLGRDLGIPSGFSEIKRSDYKLMIKRVISEAGLQGCPAKLNSEQVTQIFDDLASGKGVYNNDTGQHQNT